jgi:hypothetical protein
MEDFLPQIMPGPEVRSPNVSPAAEALGTRAQDSRALEARPSLSWQPSPNSGAAPPALINVLSFNPALPRWAHAWQPGLRPSGEFTF